MPWSPYFPLSIGKICTQNREILAGLSPGDFPLLTLSFAKLVQPGFRHCLGSQDPMLGSQRLQHQQEAPIPPLQPCPVRAHKSGVCRLLCRGVSWVSIPSFNYCLCPLKRAQTDSFGQTLFQTLAQPPNTRGRSQNPAAQSHGSLVWKKGVSVCAQSCQTLCDPMDCSSPGSSVRGISQARILEWVAISFSRASSWPRDQSHVFRIFRRILYHWATREAPWKKGVCCVGRYTPACSEPDMSWAGCFPPLPTPGPAQLQQCPLPFHLLPSISAGSQFGELLPSGLKWKFRRVRAEDARGTKWCLWGQTHSLSHWLEGGFFRANPWGPH